ncbi:MAG: hypothetical protein PVI46_09095 [Lysobacterales bacterium]
MSAYGLHTMRSPRQREDDPLNLRGLPLVDPPGDAWPAIEAALLRRSGRQRAMRIAGGTLAAAATVTLALALYLTAPDGSNQPGKETPRLAAGNTTTASDQTGGPIGDETVGETDGEAPGSGEQLDSLIALSQRLEGRLRLMRKQAGDMPSRALVYQVELEDLVVQVDDALSMNPDSVPLWNQRVNLLADLNTLYEDRLRREYRQIASL